MGTSIKIVQTEYGSSKLLLIDIWYHVEANVSFSLVMRTKIHIPTI